LEWRLPETTRLPRCFHSTHEIVILHQLDGPYSTQLIIDIPAYEYHRVAVVKSIPSDPNIEPDLPTAEIIVSVEMYMKITAN